MKINWNKTFMLNEYTSIECGWQNTRYGFRHLAVLSGGGAYVKTKACYYNRTWESYEYQSVVHAAIRKAFKKEEAEKYIAQVDAQAKGEIDKKFGMIAGIAKLGEILCDKQEDKNTWKKRMLKAGIPEIDFPDDFDSLPEEEKQRRLDGAIKQISDPPPCCDPRLSNVTP